MADRYLLESGAPDGYQQEDASGVLLLEQQAFSGAEESDSWFGGVMLCGALVAASLLAASPAPALAQQVTTQAQDEVYSPVSRGGSGLILPIFPDAGQGTYLQPWVYEQNELPPHAFPDEAYQPPAPWPATTSPAFIDDEIIVPQPPPAIALDAGEWPLPLPWPATTAGPVVDTEEIVPQPAPTISVTEDQYQPPAPWPVPIQPIYLLALDERPTPTAALPVTEDQYQPPAPWPQAYVLRPMAGGGSRSDLVGVRGDEYEFQPPRAWAVPPQPLLLWPQDESVVPATPLNVTEDEFQPPAPWFVAPQPLYWFAPDDWPTPAAPLAVEDDGFRPAPAFVDLTNVMLWLSDEAPPFNYTEDEWQPPRPWLVRVQVPDPWFASDDRPQPAAPLGVEPDPWPLPASWPATAHRALVWPQDEWPTPPPPSIVETDTWPIPAPWPIAPSLTPVWPQDEIASLAALGQDESGAQPVLLAWPYWVSAQPQWGEDERPTPTPIAESMDELFPKVFVERRWVVPQPWEVEQHMLAFLSPHVPVVIRDRSGPRYIVVNTTAPKLDVDDESNPRYEVEP